MLIANLAAEFGTAFSRAEPTRDTGLRRFHIPQGRANFTSRARRAGAVVARRQASLNQMLSRNGRMAALTACNFM
jgi:hypothetical protein